MLFFVIRLPVLVPIAPLGARTNVMLFRLHRYHGKLNFDKFLTLFKALFAIQGVYEEKVGTAYYTDYNCKISVTLFVVDPITVVLCTP